MTEPEMSVQEIEISAKESGRRIDRFLGHRLFPDYSRSYLTGLIEAGRIKVDGKRVRKNYRLAEGETITLELTAPNPQTPEAEDIPLEIIHEEEQFVVINKPDGFIVHPGTGAKSGTLVNALLHRYPDLARVGIAYRPGIVHRLDKETTGIILVARTNLARYNLVEQFKSRKVEKEYLAVAVGDIAIHSDYIDLPLGRDPKNPEKMKVDPVNGKPASSFYEVVEHFEDSCLVKIQLHTGRTHQIRVHMTHLGFPLVGDAVYGRGKNQKYSAKMKEAASAGKVLPVIDRHALHAWKLSFLHPESGERVYFEAPLPRDLEQLIEWLRAERDGSDETPA